MGAIDTQIGWVIETTAGLAATPTAFNPLLPDGDGVTIERERLEAAGIIAGANFLTSDQWNGGNITIEGDLNFELYNRGLGKLFRGMFGGIATTGAGPYTHTFTPGDLSDDTLTVQIGVPGAGGTIHPKTLAGVSVTEWELAVAAGEIATLSLTVAATEGHIGSRVVTDGVLNSTTLVTSATAAFTQADKGKRITATGIPAGTYIASVTSATNIVLSAAASATASGVTVTIGMPLASASYLSTQKPFKFNHASLSLFGSATNVNATAVTIKGVNTLKTDRRFLGNQNIALAKQTGLREVTGTVELEFYDLTQWDRFAAGSEGALVFAFTNGTDTATITCNVRYDNAQIQGGSRDMTPQSVDFKAIRSSTDASAITAVLVNSDATP